jgi:hypothetical protein
VSIVFVARPYILLTGSYLGGKKSLESGRKVRISLDPRTSDFRDYRGITHRGNLLALAHEFESTKKFPDFFVLKSRGLIRFDL